MNRLLILGTLNDELSTGIRHYQERLSSLTGNLLALRFPAHITIRGPFWTETGLARSRDWIENICRSYRQIEIVLNGPASVDPDLCWLEVDPASAGFAGLRELHMKLEDEVGSLVAIDDVPANHKGENYRPHVTLGWGTDSATHRNLPAWRATGFLDRVAVAVYPQNWPIKGNVEIIESLALKRLKRL